MPDVSQTVLALECGTCGWRWPEIYTMPMPAEAFVLRGKSLRCPHCGNLEGAPPRDAILLLGGKHYEDAMRLFRERGLVPPGTKGG